MIKPYCTQNNGDCRTCSLVNYNRDCRNYPLTEAKVKLIFDVTPTDKAEFEVLCKQLGVTKIDFLRRAIAEAKEAVGGDRL